MRANNDVDEREYVGVGFMNLKEMVEEQGTLFNTKVKIQDLGGNVTAHIRTNDYGGLFRKKFRIDASDVERYDGLRKISGFFTRAFSYLKGLFSTFLGPAITLLGLTSGDPLNMIKY